MLEIIKKLENGNLSPEEKYIKLKKKQNLPDRLNSRMEMIEKGVTGLKDRSIEIIQPE